MLLGPNGSGKSTLLKVIGGLLQPQKGQIKVVGPTGFVFQNPDHQVVLPTVLTDVTFGLSSLRLPVPEVRAKAVAALESVGLAGFEERQISTLSGGEKQRVAIAGVLARRPAVLLLDELTTYLADMDRRSVMAAVKALLASAEPQVAAVWVTHRLEEVAAADRVTYLEAGQVVKSGRPADVLSYLEQQGANIG